MSELCISIHIKTISLLIKIGRPQWRHYHVSRQWKTLFPGIHCCRPDRPLQWCSLMQRPLSPVQCSLPHCKKYLEMVWGLKITKAAFTLQVLMPNSNLVCFLATSDKIYNGYIYFKSDSYQISAFTLHTWWNNPWLKYWPWNMVAMI